MTELRARGFSNINQGMYVPAVTATRIKSKAEERPSVEANISVVSKQAHSLKTSSENSSSQLSSAGKISS